MEDSKQPRLQSETAGDILPTFPFTYERTNDPNKASYRQWRISPVSIVGKENKPSTDEEIIQMVKEEKERKDWFLLDYWRKKGMPQEQLEIQVSDKLLTVYNFNKEVPFTEEHAVRAKRVLEQLESIMPQVIEKIDWILIDDIAHPSAFGDPDKYPWNGNAMRSYRAFRFLPRGMELAPHRIEAVSNFEGTMVHEITHLVESDYEKEWSERGFVWDFCIDYPDEWEVRLTPDGNEKRFYNKKTGEMAPTGMFPLQPDQCINYYARGHIDEDICESMVAYIYNPELLRKISPDKFDILENHDLKKPKTGVSIRRIPKDQIRLPEINQEIILYYIQEPESK